MLEVCVDSIESAIAAAAGGAKRIELCTALSEGGLTPTAGLLKTVKRNIKQSVAVYVMLRTHRGSDFIYSDQEMDVILDDIETFKINGADGFVFGALTEEGEVDVDKCNQVLNACRPLPVAFHRAFDVCKEPFEALEKIIELGFIRILTSGMAETASEGTYLIKDLVSKAGDRICIMPGSGISVTNIRDIMEQTGAKEFHASVRVKKIINVSGDRKICMGKSDEPIYVTDWKLVEELVKAIATAPN